MQYRIAVLGASGFVGQALCLRLLESGHEVVALVRHPEKLPSTLLEQCTVYQINTCEKKPEHIDIPYVALEQIDVLFYLVHSMEWGADFGEVEAKTALHIGSLCKKHRIKRIIYLGALGDEKGGLSRHLRSRQKVGEILRSFACVDIGHELQVIEFRSSIIIGKGSISFEMIRSLVKRLPIMITPKWVFTKTQPIGMNDLLKFLVKACDKASDLPVSLQTSGAHIYEIGAPEQVSYADLMQMFSQIDRKRPILYLKVPFITPKLSSLWLSLVTPLQAKIGRYLVESAEFTTIIHDSLAEKEFDIHPISIKLALEDTLEKIKKTENKKITVYEEEISFVSGASIDALFSIIEQEGLTTKSMQNWRRLARWLWDIRTFIEKIFGGKAYPSSANSCLQKGDRFDFWEVIDCKRGKSLLVKSLMKLPGTGAVQISLYPIEEHKTILRIKVQFQPSGVLGKIYWHMVRPFHDIVFQEMIRSIDRLASTCKGTGT